MSGSSSIPSLPAGWPFSSREGAGELHSSPGAAIRGLGSGWDLRLRAGLSLEGATGTMAGVFGRGGILRLGDVVVRPYRRGGLLRHFNERVYASPDRFAQEFAVHRTLWAAGFPTVEPLGYGSRRRAWGVEGVFLTRFAEAKAWPACWERSADILPQVVVMLKALASWGLLAPDLNATNFLLTPEGRVLALDWDRAAWKPGGDLLGRYRERLVRSLLKLQAPGGLAADLARELAD